jgi:hypothetical protein
MDLQKYDQITIQKSLTIKWLRFSKKYFSYYFVLHYTTILNPNNKFGM